MGIRDKSFIFLFLCSSSGMMNKRNEEPIIFLSTNIFRYAMFLCSENSLISKLLMSGTWRWLSLGRVAGKVSCTVLRHHKKRLTKIMEGFRSGNREPQSWLGRRYVHCQFFNCHFFTVTEVLSHKRSLSECSLISNQNKTKNISFPFCIDKIISTLQLVIFFHSEELIHVILVKRFGEKTS